MTTHLLERGRALCGKTTPGVVTTELLPRVTCRMCLGIIARRAKPYAPKRAGTFSASRICRVCRRPRAIVGGRFVQHVDERGQACAGSGAIAPSVGLGGTRE